MSWIHKVLDLSLRRPYIPIDDSSVFEFQIDLCSDTELPNKIRCIGW